MECLFAYKIILFFNILKDCHAIFYCNCTILQSHQQYEKVPISPIMAHLSSGFGCYTVAILLGMR